MTSTLRELPAELLYPILDALLASFERDKDMRCDHYRPAQPLGSLDYTRTELESKECFKACSLVCKRWNAIAQPYTFDTLALRFEAGDDRNDARDMASVFTSLASASSPAHRVRLLRIIVLQGPVFLDVIDEKKSNQIRHVLGQLPHLHTLNFVDFFPEGCNKPLGAEDKITPASVINLDTVSLFCTGTQVPTEGDIMELASWFGDVKKFAIRAPPGLCLTSAVSESPHLSLMGFSARSLDIRAISVPGLEYLIPHLLSSSMFCSSILEQLTLGVDPVNGRAIELLLAAAPMSLNALTLDLTYLAHHSELGVSNVQHRHSQLPCLSHIIQMTITLMDCLKLISQLSNKLKRLP